ncbi:MAG: hypothetical protein ACI9MC_001348 [Kiritimatiellia bacterium]
MLPSTHPLAALQTRAALYTGWPVLHAFADDEATILKAQATLQDALDGCPQSDVIEPWDPSDKEDRWELRAVLPGLTTSTWAALTTALSADLQATPTLVPGVAPGTMEAQDQQAIVSDAIEGDPLTALLWSATEQGGSTPPDLVEEPGDAVGGLIAADLVSAIASVAPKLTTRDLVAFVRNRNSGRRGIQLNVPFDLLDGVSGDQLLRLREDLLDAVAQVVVRRAESEHALAPDIGWDPRWGLTFLLWRVDSRGPSLPGDSPIGNGITPPVERLAPWIAGIDGRYGALEIQVVPRTDADHTDVVQHCIDAAEGTELVGGMPRWIPARDGLSVRPAFVPTWRCSMQHAPILGDWLRQVQANPSVLGVRVVPVEAAGLEEQGPFLDPCWLWMGDTYIVRLRDGALQRDRLVRTRTRDHVGRDRLAQSLLAQVLARVPQAVEMEGRHLVRTMADDSGRQGLELRLTSDLLEAPQQLAWILQNLAALPLPDATSVIELALPTTGPLLRWWYRHTAEKWDAPTWL